MTIYACVTVCVESSEAMRLMILRVDRKRGRRWTGFMKYPKQQESDKI
jgi:hypothetical protein